ncbi:MAG: glycosyltransferase family 4 protein [Cyclobacteriaceae bacterium]|nr:glycosyltransferase family 4 protein [Cyclobacteriaceae bacterium]
MTKKCIAFICPYPVGQSPSQRFRFEQYFELLSSNNFEYHVYPFLGVSSWKILYKKGNSVRKIFGILSGFTKRFGLLFNIGKFDFIFIHREATPIGPPFFEWMIANFFRKKIIYDFDDAIWLANTSDENKIISGLKWHHKFNVICNASYRLSCGNQFLADYALQFNNALIVNPTTIDTIHHHNPDKHPIAQNKNKIIIGWTGSHSTLPYLTPLLPVIETLWKKYPEIELLIIADKNPEWQQPFINFVQWSKDTEIDDLMKIDIGIMPMPNETWTKGKCGFKALQYMSLKKPALVSPVGVNSEIVDQVVNGFLCSTEEDWIQHLEYLLHHPEARKTMGEKGREKVEKYYSVSSNSSTFLSLFE